MSVQNKNFNQAIKLLTKAIEIQPNHPSANHNLSVALVEMAEFRKAFYYSQKADFQFHTFFVEIGRNDTNTMLRTF